MVQPALGLMEAKSTALLNRTETTSLIYESFFLLLNTGNSYISQSNLTKGAVPLGRE